jgi:hypothetical protein
MLRGKRSVRGSPGIAEPGREVEPSMPSGTRRTHVRTSSKHASCSIPTQAANRGHVPAVSTFVDVPAARLLRRQFHFTYV